MLFFKKMMPGILLCILVSIPAWFLGKTFPIIGGPVFGILFGMILTLVFPDLIQKTVFSIKAQSLGSCVRLSDGVLFTAKKILQYSIILIGFEMNLFHIFKVGVQSLSVMLFTLLISFLTAYFLGKMMKLGRNTVILIGVGTSICGGSAIAATAPVIKAGPKEIAHSISTIFLFNIAAVFIFPALGHLIGMSDLGFGMWAGTAINDTSSVLAAGQSWSNSMGNNTALNFATVVKLTRTLMIVPIALFLSLYFMKKDKEHSSERKFHFVKVFPWFIIGFIGAAVANTVFFLPDDMTHFFVQAGKFMIVMAMAAIGLNTHLKQLVANGWKPIFLGLCCWIAVAVTALIVQYCLGLL